jgi:hypothetical protein
LEKPCDGEAELRDPDCKAAVLPPRKPAFAPVKEPPREAEKKRCDPTDEPLRMVDEFGSRFEGLKLSREGFTGILPVMALACRNDSALMLS